MAEWMRNQERVLGLQGGLRSSERAKEGERELPTIRKLYDSHARRWRRMLKMITLSQVWWRSDKAVAFKGSSAGRIAEEQQQQVDYGNFFHKTEMSSKKRKEDKSKSRLSKQNTKNNVLKVSRLIFFQSNKWKWTSMLCGCVLSTGKWKGRGVKRRVTRKKSLTFRQESADVFIQQS